MYTLKAENNRGNVINLTGNSNYTVYKITGLNPPQANISSSANSTSDGMSINNVRVESRNIVIYMTIEGNVESNRLNLYRHFPLKKNVKLYFSNDSRNVSIEGVVEVIECDIFSNKQVAQISIICPKPYFKDVDELISNFSDITSNFTFPFSIAEAGIEFSTIGGNARKSIINTGDVDTGIIIKLFAIGTVVNPVIYDVFNNTHFKLKFTMQTSDTILINTNVGEKSVQLIRDGVTTNVMGYMQSDSTWFTLAAGDNVFTYETDSGTSNLQITFTTSLLYGGV